MLCVLAVRVFPLVIEEYYQQLSREEGMIKVSCNNKAALVIFDKKSKKSLQQAATQACAECSGS